MNPVIDTEAAATAARLSRRPWPTRLLDPSVRFSFEFFPPAAGSDSTVLEACAQTLDAYDPTFMSVTYGAGGTSQDRTIGAIEALSRSVCAPVAGHLTCVGATRAELHAVLDRYRELGVRTVVALRGDDPAASGGATGEVGDAIGLIELIRSRPDGDSFEIAVAAYPETHPLAASREADLAVLRRKFDAGADVALTQFFFDPSVFVEFLAEARDAGVSGTLIPGIMPVSNFANVVRFSERCGTEVPAWMFDLFEGLDDAPEIQKLVGATLAAEQCRILAEHGITRFHLYTLNRPELATAVCRSLGVSPSRLAAARTA